MFHLLRSTISPSPPKLLYFQNHPWIFVKFASTISQGNSFTVSYLINNCGFSPERAASVSNRIRFETQEKPDSVIEFFKNHGFSHTMALSIIRKFPQFLQSDPAKSLQPKFDFLKSRGFSDSDIHKIVMGYPNILSRSLNREIIPCFDFFRNMFQSDDKLMKNIIRNPGTLCDLGNHLAPNIKLLREAGVPKSHIIRLVEYFPRALKIPPKRFKDKVEEVKVLEFNPSRLEFILALHVKIGLSKCTWAKKVCIYKRWCWTNDDIRAAFRTQPFCMTVSDHKIEGIMDFLVNKLGYKSSAIARCPVVTCMSLKKRIVPRGSVILVLRSKGLVSQLSLSAIYKCNETDFLDRFIFSYKQERGELWKLYKAKLALAAAGRIKEIKSA